MRETDFEFLMSDNSTISTKHFFARCYQSLRAKHPGREKTGFRIIKSSSLWGKARVLKPMIFYSDEEKKIIEDIKAEWSRVQGVEKEVLKIHNQARFGKLTITSFEEITKKGVDDLRYRKRQAIAQCYDKARARKPKNVSRTDAGQAVTQYFPELEGRARAKMIDNVRQSAHHRLFPPKKRRRQ